MVKSESDDLHAEKDLSLPGLSSQEREEADRSKPRCPSRDRWWACATPSHRDIADEKANRGSARGLLRVTTYLRTTCGPQSARAENGWVQEYNKGKYCNSFPRSSLGICVLPALEMEHWSSQAFSLRVKGKQQLSISE